MNNLKLKWFFALKIPFWHFLFESFCFCNCSKFFFFFGSVVVITNEKQNLQVLRKNCVEKEKKSKMIPYQAVAMDYAGYQRQTPSSSGHMGMSLGMGVGGPAFTHSWLVPTQDLCAVPYKQMPNQHQNSVMHPQQSLEPGHVLDFP